MKKILSILALILPIYVSAQINIVDTFSTEVYQVYTGSTFRGSYPKGESFIDVDASGRIGIRQQSGAQITTYSNWTSYRYNGASFGSFVGAVDSLGKGIGISPSSGGGLSCIDILACLENVTAEQPFIQPSFTAFSEDTQFDLQENDLEFIGTELSPGQILTRFFDPFGNDIGGIEGTNSIGTDNLFNSIKGIGNQIGNSSDVNTVYGFSNIVANDCDVNHIVGVDINMSNTVNQSAGYGEGHTISVNRSYVFGIFGAGNFAGIAVGNGIDIDNLNNSIELREDGSIRHQGAYANKPIHYTAGGSVIIPDNVSIFVYDPDTLQTSETITLPANPIDGQTLYILGGGTITTGNVINSFTLDGNGRLIIGDGASTLKVGKAIELHYLAANNIWYAIAN